MEKHGGNIYKNKVRYDFSSSINPFGMAERVRLAAIDSLEFSARYPDPSCREFRDKLAKKINFEISKYTEDASVNSVKSPDSFLIGSGVAELIYALIFYVAKNHPGSSAYFAVPTFSEYRNAAETAGMKAEEYFLREEDDFNFTDETADDFLRKIPEDCSIIFFCNPGNPNGQLIEHMILKRMIDAICDINALRASIGMSPILICVDESFLSLTGQFWESFLTEDHLLVLRSFTKLYAMAGLRLGYMHGAPETLSEIRAFLQPWNVSIPAQMAGEEAMQMDDYVSTSLALIERERDYLFTNLEELELHPFRSDANYILFSYDKDRQENTNSLYGLLKSNGLLVRDCSNFDGLLNGFYRIAVRTRVENYELIQTLKQIVESSEDEEKLQ